MHTRLSRRDVLKAAGAVGGLAIALPWLSQLVVAAEDEVADEPMGPFGPWDAPTPITELASTSGDFHPSISRDGLSLFFTTDRSAPPLTEIWVSRRGSLDSLWGSPQPGGGLQSSGANTCVPH